MKMQEIKHYFEFIRYAMNPGVQSVPGVNGGKRSFKNGGTGTCFTNNRSQQ